MFPHVSRFIILYHTKFHPNICFHSEVSKTFQKNKPSEKLGAESRALPFLCSGPTGPGKQKDPVQRQQDHCFCVCVCTLEVWGQAGRGSVGHSHVKLPCERSLCPMYLVLQKFLSVRELWERFWKRWKESCVCLCGSLLQQLFSFCFYEESGRSIKSWQVQGRKTLRLICLFPFLLTQRELLFFTQCCSFGHFFRMPWAQNITRTQLPPSS